MRKRGRCARRVEGKGTSRVEDSWEGEHETNDRAMPRKNKAGAMPQPTTTNEEAQAEQRYADVAAANFTVMGGGLHGRARRQRGSAGTKNWLFRGSK
jgi:hypothetical protein